MYVPLDPERVLLNQLFMRRSIATAYRARSGPRATRRAIQIVQATLERSNSSHALKYIPRNLLRDDSVLL
jgi:hypothetical protein